jgi:uncharacterized paraquat-inducible protein A
MNQTCPHCGEQLPYVVDAFCPQCREDLSAPPLRLEQLAAPAPPTAEQIASDHSIAFQGAAGMTVVAYGMLIFALFAPGVRQKAVQLFGPNPLGLPAIVLVALIAFALFLPMPRAFYHFGLINRQAERDQFGIQTRHALFALLFNLVYLADVEYRHPHLAQSKWICLGAVGYCLAIMGITIVYSLVGNI